MVFCVFLHDLQQRESLHSNRTKPVQFFAVHQSHWVIFHTAAWLTLLSLLSPLFSWNSGRGFNVVTTKNNDPNIGLWTAHSPRHTPTLLFYQTTPRYASPPAPTEQLLEPSIDVAPYFQSLREIGCLQKPRRTSCQYDCLVLMWRLKPCVFRHP